MDTRTLLENLGGQAAVAKECGITDSAVSQWTADDRIPDARRMYLRLAHPGPWWAKYDAHHPMNGAPDARRARGHTAKA